MTARKRWHVEFDVEQFDGEWVRDRIFKELEMDDYFIQIPTDATITELPPELEVGYYVSTGSGSLYCLSATRQWSIWVKGGMDYIWERRQHGPSRELIKFLAPLGQGEEI